MKSVNRLFYENRSQENKLFLSRKPIRQEGSKGAGKPFIGMDGTFGAIRRAGKNCCRNRDYTFDDERIPSYGVANPRGGF
jgi:hypothetical protein